jgi:hypothetical protein
MRTFRLVPIALLTIVSLAHAEGAKLDLVPGGETQAPDPRPTRTKNLGVVLDVVGGLLVATGVSFRLVGNAAWERDAGTAIATGGLAMSIAGVVLRPGPAAGLSVGLSF